MKKSISTLSAALLMVAGTALAQNETDVLRYSQLGIGGTARFSGMAGAFGALGADMSTLSYNPAGIGLFRRGEVALTPSVYYQSTGSDYNGTHSDDQKLNFNFGNVGIVFAKNLERETNHSGWKFVQFGVNMDRLASFQSNVTVTGKSYASLLDQYVNQANGNTPPNLDPFTTGLAYNAYMIDTIPGTNQSMYKSPLGLGQHVIQTKNIGTSGAMNETAISFGGNYMDKLFLGATIGIDNLHYNENVVYSEVSAGDGGPNNFQAFTMKQNLHTTGSGFNFKFGAIYKPVEFLRIGFAVHTPTWLSLTDNWNSSMVSTFSNHNHDTTSTSPDGSYNYSITTPMRMIASLGVVSGKYGVIDIDYEYVNYSTGRLSNTGASVFTDQNNALRHDLSPASNVRVGAELKLNPVNLRAGFAYYGDPYSSSTTLTGTRMSYTAGIGIRNKHAFADFAYVLTTTSSNYYVIDPAPNVNAATNSTSMSSYMLTLGLKF
jgi:hypothetical protein